MTGEEILNKLEDLRAYEDELEEEVAILEEDAKDLSKRLYESETAFFAKERELAKTKQEIQELEDEAKAYWNK